MQILKPFQSKNTSTTKISKVAKVDEQSDLMLDDNYFFGKNLLTNGVLFLIGEVNEDNVTPLVASILEYNLMSENQQPDHITLFINSPGGLLCSAYHLIDTIKSSNIPVVTVGMGEVASAALMILMTGTKGHRLISENASIMSHQYSRGIGGKEHEIVAAAKEVSLDTQRIITHYRKCTKKSEAYIRKHLLPQSDCYLTPEEAVKHGVADQILNIYDKK